MDDLVKMIGVDGDGEASPEQISAMMKEAFDSPVIRFVNMLLIEGIKRHASDIFIEPWENFVRVRARVDGLLEEIVRIDPAAYHDLHVMRFYSAFVAVSDERVVKVTTPQLNHCVLADSLYRMMRGAARSGGEKFKEAVKRVVEGKIAEFGFFTERRRLFRKDIAIPYGASEMMMVALRKGILDAAVLVCDGAGTVIATSPGAAQGIGARMNGLFLTSPIESIRKEIERRGSHVPFADGAIRQIMSFGNFRRLNKVC